MKKIALAVAALLALAAPARADYLYQSPGGILTIKSGVVGGAVVPYSSPVDQTGAPFGNSANPFHVVCDASTCGGGGGGGGAVFGPTGVGAAAANPPVMVGGTTNGTAAGPVSILKVDATGTAFINCANCSGTGVSVGFGGAIGSVGTPGGFKDGGGNFQPLLGDVTNGQWVSIKASVALPVTGTFWPYTLGQQLSAASVPVVLPAAQVTALTPPTSVGISGTLPAFAATPTFNIGTAPTITVSGAVTANAGTNLNTSLLAVEGGGHLASIDTKTPSLGQALAASSVPVVLTAAQLTTLTPPAAITGFALDASVGTTNTNVGAPGATACATDTGSCSVNALTQRLAQRLTTINATLGTPFQAGGSIGNASFGISGTLPAFAATPTFNLGTLNGAATAANQTSVIGPVTPGTAATNSLLAAGTFNSTPITVTNAQQAPLQVDANGFLKVNVAVGGGTGGTSSTFAAAFPSTGTAAGMSQGGNMVALTGTAGNLNVQCANCSGSGASAIDAAAFTAGSSVFAPTGGQFTSGGATACVTGHQCLSAITADRAMFVNMADIAGTATLTGNGATGAGSQRVTIASDNTAFSVNAAQSGTWNITNVSGTVSLPTGASTSANQPTNAAQGSTTSGQTGNLHLAAVTTAAPAYTTGQSSPLSMTTAGALRVDGSGVTQPVSLTSTTITGTVAVTQSGSWSLAANQSVNVAQINGVTPLMGNGATGTGSQRVTIASDNTAFSVNATLQASASTAIGKVDPNTIGSWGLVASTQNSATPTNGMLAVGQFNTTPTTITSGNVSPIQVDSAGNLLVNIKAGSASGAVAQGSTTSGQSGGLTQAAVTTSAPTYTTATTNPLSLTTAGDLRTVFSNSTIAVTNTGTFAVQAAQSGTWNIGSITTLPALVAGSALIGKVGIDQTTPGTTNAVSLAQIGATTVSAGAGAVGAGSQRVAVGQDTTTLAGSAPGTAGTPSANVVSVQGEASMTPIASNQTQYGGTAVVSNPCLTGTLSYLPVSQATSTQILALGGSSKKNYVCAVNIVGADAENISVVEGTGAVCATTPSAIMGGTTAANGWNFAANGGLSQGNGAAPIAAGSLTSLNNVCILQSGTGRVAGSIVIAQQ